MQNNILKMKLAIICLTIMFVISTTWAFGMTLRWNENYAYIQAGKSYVTSAESIRDTLRNCGSDDVCESMRRGIGETLVDSIVAQSPRKRHIENYD